MPTAFPNRENATIQSAGRTGRYGRGVYVLLILSLSVCLAPSAEAAVTVSLQTNGGITITAVGGNFASTFGTMNALAVGTPQSGVTAITTTSANGALYYTTFDVSANGLKNGDTAVVKAYVSTNFNGLAASAMILQSCPSTSTCNAEAQFSALGTSQAAEATLASGLIKGANTAKVGLAIFLPDNAGGSAFTGSASAVVTLDLYLNGAATTTDTTKLTLNNPTSETVQDAVQLKLAQATGGLAVGTSPADFSMDFGTVNGLGIGPVSGLSASSQTGGFTYATPYNLQPVFTNINAAASTIKVCVSTNFAHPLLLVLQDSTTVSGPFSNISTTCGAGATTLTSSAGNRSTVSRYLGLFVSNINGASAFTGVDTATLTYTLTVP